MIQVCCYKGCGVVYGKKEPMADKRVTHGLCPKHYKISLKQLRARMENERMARKEREGQFRL